MSFVCKKLKIAPQPHKSHVRNRVAPGPVGASKNMQIDLHQLGALGYWLSSGSLGAPSHPTAHAAPGQEVHARRDVWLVSKRPTPEIASGIAHADPATQRTLWVETPLGVRLACKLD